jgi:hypothetical protein
VIGREIEAADAYADSMHNQPDEEHDEMLTADTITDEQIHRLIDEASCGRLNAHKRATIKDAHAALAGDRTCRARCAEILNARSAK